MNFKKEILKKTLASFLAISMMLSSGGFFGLAGLGVVLAQEIPTPPPAPTAPTAPTAPPQPTAPGAPTPPPAPTSPPTPTTPPSPTAAPSHTPRPTYSPNPTPVSGVQNPNATTEPPVSANDNEGSTNSASNSPAANFDVDETGGEHANGATNGASVNSGDANSSGAVLTDGNSNLAGVPQTGSGGGATVTNSGNASNSNNNGSATVTENNSTNQNNSANITTDLHQAALSGNNSASENVGNSQVVTGDSNTSGTIITAVNSNVAGFMVSEFNVVDDHMGDLILDFGSSCIVGCGVGDSLVSNENNGSGSLNNSDLTQTSNNATTQNNDLVLTNNMGLIADSGDNHADDNVGGDSTIITGDANVSANVLTFANNNIAGGVVYGVVNIFGNLIGDIILPEQFFQTCCGASDVSVVNSGNGPNSTNDAAANIVSNDSTQQFNNLELVNNIILDANTGDNRTSDNVGGVSSITTGNASADVQLVNFANNNIVGGNWWLVIVNEAGRWVGHIMGADGHNFGGSEGFAFDVADTGEITVANTGNAADSTSQASYNSTDNNSTSQNNTATIVNNLDLSANSGDNSASDNTGGNSRVVTGDADIVANIVNFVNNNITGGGRLVVSVVNVFGSWLGDFVGPGFHKDTPPAQNDNNEDSATNPKVNGGGGSSNSQSDSSSNNNSNTGSSNGSTSSPANTARTVLGAFASRVSTVNLTNDGGGTTSLIGSSSVSKAIAAKKSVNLNLAWVIIAILPLGLATIILRRRYFFINLLSRKKND